VQHKVADQLAEMDIGYPESPLTVKNGHVHNDPKSGERWPDRLPATQEPTHTTALRLIRPDGYVAYAGAAKDQKQAEAYLSALAAG
jgi:hypothetical protein